MLPWFGAVSKNKEELNWRYSTAVLFASTIAPIGLLCALLVFEFIVPSLFPSDFISPNEKDFTSQSIFQLLIIAWSIAVLSSPFLEIVRATKSAYTVNLIQSFSLSLCLLCAFFTVSEFGVYGAAISMIAPQLTFMFFFISSIVAEKSASSLDFPISHTLRSLITSFSPLIFFVPDLEESTCWIILLCITLSSFSLSANSLRKKISYER